MVESYTSKRLSLVASPSDLQAHAERAASDDESDHDEVEEEEEEEEEEEGDDDAPAAETNAPPPTGKQSNLILYNRALNFDKVDKVD